MEAAQHRQCKQGGSSNRSGKNSKAKSSNALRSAMARWFEVPECAKMSEIRRRKLGNTFEWV